MFYTDEMPKNCRECPCADSEYGVCNIDYNVALHPDDRPEECPLQEVKHGKWIPDGECWCKCSICGQYELSYDRPRMSNYCCNCGSKMDEQVN